MKKSTNTNVQAFLDALIEQEEKENIVAMLRDIVFDVYPQVSEEIKYGWILLSSGTNFWGIFVYTEHVTMEFSDGVKLSDPGKYLQWTGKKRRHLKFVSVWDVEEDNVKLFIAQAVELAKTW